MDIQNKILKAAADLSKELGQARKDFTRNLITISTGFLALFIGLKSDSIENECAKYFFLATIILLVLGILFSTISLYQEIYFIRKNERFLKKKLNEHLEGKLIEEILFNYTDKPWFIRACEFIGYAAFILSTFVLIGYVYFLE
ncbi:hypothetical protein SAMN04488028_103266 [Reichenbachiella agariperforans]|uniref:Uncharacterized protein n=1 Tax=Reichenbachiella agariperforans TaxID=156994 RepID=A0A1M6QBX4_REIAG|nr:hypothetical protein [Reichenbachiella agariperforans]SHK17814.1 hypothetical protein SAMN04488028_103266 [Reichenbachiella agariperforans]